MTNSIHGRHPARAVAVMVLFTALSGCTLFQDDMCVEGEQPVYALNHPNGGACIADEAPVPEGFAKYPEKRVPHKVGDQYDRWPLAEDYPWADEVG
ncbi:hypothetical protein [Tessaracoccus antarcticus]|uniref:Lipoprotein n=1 Tax=Tessaracoccus antarcticus TaxID=2479848 RepID=A0A3M0G666_9ACTN|nr:hypothetical protein [Tessaracoccus antarcticus]RMB57772.1 hypothetical protein EAX62_15015 [Tessaracoccus antarcticus]